MKSLTWGEIKRKVEELGLNDNCKVTIDLPKEIAQVVDVYGYDEGEIGLKLDNELPSLPNLQPVKACQDNEGHWYVIPEDKASQFHSMLMQITEELEHEQENYGSATEGFEDTFGEYRTGGDLNLVQLYAEK